MNWAVYPDYAESGVPWLGTLPSHWTTPHLGHIVECLDAIRIPLNASERAEVPGDVPYWGANGVVGSVDRPLVDGELVLLGEDGAPFTDRTKEKAFYVNEPIWPNNHIHVLRSWAQIMPQFLAYALNATEYSWFIEGSTREKLTQTKMLSIPIAMPPLAEQCLITGFLDRETAKIDALIDKQEQLIATLREDRAATITQAVTFGLGSANRPVERQQLRRLALIRNGADHSEVQDDFGEFPVYGSGGEFTRASRPLYSGPSVLLGRKGTIDRPLLVDGEFWTVDTMFCAQPYANVDPTFLYYACTTIPFDLLSTSTALPSMTQSSLNSVRLPKPSYEEQRAVADFLDDRCSKIDALIDKATEMIQVLREYRSALITNAVTGKIDVREAV